MYEKERCLPSWIDGVLSAILNLQLKNRLTVNCSSFSRYHWQRNGERGIWTLAPVARPTPLAGAPLRPLEYFSVKIVYGFYSWTTAVLISSPHHIQYQYKIVINGGESGIRTRERSHAAGFQDRCFQPLSHLSVSVNFTDADYYNKNKI